MELKPGERVRVKNRPDWPSPPGFRLVNSEGIVVRIWEKDIPDGPKEFEEYIEIKLEKADVDINLAHTYTFRLENLKKITC
jgi:hypothetical protein